MQANSSSLGSSRRAPSISVTWQPSVWNACDISTPTTPPPMHHQALGDLLGDRRVAVRPRAVDRVQAVDRRHQRQRAGGEEDGALGLDLLVADGHPALARAAAPWPRMSVDAAVLEPRQLRAVVEVVDDLVAARERRRDVERAGHGLGRARDRA